MKRKTILCVIAGAVIFCCMGAYFTQTSIHQPYKVLRAEADENTPIDLTTAGNFAAMPSGALQLKPITDSGPENAIELIFSGGDASNDTFGWRLYGWRQGNGPAKLIGHGTGILGTQAVVVYPQGGAATSKYWADSLTITTDYWMRTLTRTTAGSNSVVNLLFDFIGWEWLYVDIIEADGSTGIQAGDITVYYSYI